MKSENGSGTVFALMIISIISIFIFFIIEITGIYNKNINTQKAADLSALASSQRFIYGFNDGCIFASKIASKNNSILIKCTKVGQFKTDVTVISKKIFGYTITKSATADRK
jgi:secretion/DNA translocation related TadE-like protein